MQTKIVFWIACYLGGYLGTWAFDKLPTQPAVATQYTNYTLKISAAPTLNQIENLNGAVLGELQTAKFASLNQIENSNIVVNNQLTNNQISPAPSPTPTPILAPTATPTASPTPTPRSESVVGPTPTITPKPAPTSTPLPTPTLTLTPTPILSPTPTPTPLAYQKTINDLSSALVTNDYQTFNSFLSSELTSTFGEDAIKQSFEEAKTTYGGIIAITPISPVQQTGNWATQEVETKTQNGLTSKFRIILHLENGAWKLFGTQEIP